MEQYLNQLGFYKEATATKLGLRIQLLHRPGEVCTFRALHSIKNFEITHTNGVHGITVDFCNCDLGRNVPPLTQLMRWGLLSVACEHPQTFEAARTN